MDGRSHSAGPRSGGYTHGDVALLRGTDTRAVPRKSECKAGTAKATFEKGPGETQRGTPAASGGAARGASLSLSPVRVSPLAQGQAALQRVLLTLTRQRGSCWHGSVSEEKEVEGPGHEAAAEGTCGALTVLGEEESPSLLPVPDSIQDILREGGRTAAIPA
ncbi:unnamed protein product [Caretta caretta]